MNITLMSHNILHHWGQEFIDHPWALRQPVFESLVMKHKPDVICLQECQVKQLNDLLPRRSIPCGRGKSLVQYAVTGPFDASGGLLARTFNGNNGVHILYNTNKIELEKINCRIRLPQNGTGKGFQRPLVWGKFRVKDNNQPFLVFPSIWSAISAHPNSLK